jgi:ribonucleoside-diphosphate reductase alpha chain
VDWDRLCRTVELAVRFLDDVIEVNHFPVPQIERLSRANRKIGLGVMGFAHALILLGIPYGSHRSVSFAEELMSFITENAHRASRELARARGEFPNFPVSTHAMLGKGPLRNAHVTTIAPTGTLSIIAGCSSGIEPIYALSSTRVAAGGIELSGIDPLFSMKARESGIEVDAALSGKCGRDSECLRENLPDDLRKLFATALNIPPSQHVEIQAAFQRYTDNAVSKTINFPSRISVDEMKETLKLAYNLGCKGIAIYRDMSRAGQVIHCGTDRLC